VCDCVPLKAAFQTLLAELAGPGKLQKWWLKCLVGVYVWMQSCKFVMSRDMTKLEFEFEC